MTELAQEDVKLDKIEGMDVRETATGTIVFINTNYVTKKTVDIMVESINQMDDKAGHGIYTVVFRIDGHPRVDDNTPTPWFFFPDSKSCVCNIADCVELAFLNTMDEEHPDAAYVSIFASIWKNVLTGMFHEAHHAHHYLIDRDTLESGEDAVKEEEDKAEEFSRNHLFHMAKLMDVEIELSPIVMAMVEEHWATYTTMIEEDENASDHLKLWLANQTMHREQGTCWYDPAEEGTDQPNVLLKTFKEFLHWCSGDAEDDAEWNTPNANNVDVTVVSEPATQASNGEEGVSYGFVDDDDLPFEPDESFIVQQTPVTPAFQGVNQQFVPQTPVNPVSAQMQTPVANQPVQPAAPVAMAGAPQMPGVVANGNVDVVVGANAYAQTGMSDVEFQNAVKSVYQKLSNHIFGACGFNPQMNPCFGQKEKIVDMVPLEAHELAIVKEMKCYNATGQIQEGQPVTNWVSGIMMDKASTLPGYELTLATPQGQMLKRKLIPQNPFKVNAAGIATPPALLAQQNNCILWVIDPLSDKFNGVRVFNGKLQKSVNRVWEDVI